MGSPFDWFGEESHPDYRGISEEQYKNRATLDENLADIQYNDDLPLYEPLEKTTFLLT